MKIFNLLNAAFYVLFGLFGALLPMKIAQTFGWSPDLLGLHEIRAFFMAIAAIGCLFGMAVLQGRDQKLLTLSIIFVTLAFAAGRCIGLLLDGAGPQLTYLELGFEIIWVGIGALLYRRAPASLA